MAGKTGSFDRWHYLVELREQMTPCSMGGMGCLRDDISTTFSNFSDGLQT